MDLKKKIILSIEALDNFGVYPEIIKDIVSGLEELTEERDAVLKTVVHKCVENDSVIKVICSKYGIDEFHFKVDGDKSCGWLVIGNMDLQKAIASATKRLSYKY